MVYDIVSLQQKWKKMKYYRFTFFNGHNAVHGDNACFSLVFPSEFEDSSGMHFKSLTQYIVAKKAELFGDINSFEKAMGVTSPSVLVNIDQSIKHFDNEVWNYHRYPIIKEGNIYKFSQNSDMRDILVNTCGTIIAQTTQSDPILGIGLGRGNPNIGDPLKWPGKNYLGFILSEVRDLYLGG